MKKEDLILVLENFEKEMLNLEIMAPQKKNEN